jgi:outer membrane immunogenic protein
MRKVTVAAFGLFLSAAAQPVLAADMPTKAPVMRTAAPMFSWTGFYIGAHVGYGWGETDATTLETNAFFPAGHVNTNEFDGFLGGGQIGFNYQTGMWVFGIEAQGSWSAIDGTTIHPAVLLADRHAENLTEVDWIVTLTGRLGIAAGPVLYYLKGGAAWADFAVRNHSIQTSTGFIGQTTSGSETRFGWTIGGGIEYALGGNWSVKGEYNYLDFGTEQVTRSGTNFLTGLPVTTVNDNDTHLHVVKFGINYRFGGRAY